MKNRIQVAESVSIVDVKLNQIRKVRICDTEIQEWPEGYDLLCKREYQLPILPIDAEYYYMNYINSDNEETKWTQE